MVRFVAADAYVRSVAVRFVAVAVASGLVAVELRATFTRIARIGTAFVALAEPVAPALLLLLPEKTHLVARTFLGLGLVGRLAARSRFPDLCRY